MVGLKTEFLASISRISFFQRLLAPLLGVLLHPGVDPLDHRVLGGHFAARRSALALRLFPAALLARSMISLISGS